MGHAVTLRDVTVADLDVFFGHLQDAKARFLAASTQKDPTNRDAFFAHWEKFAKKPTVVRKTISYGNDTVGYVAKFERDGVPEVSYWIGQEHWGNGISTKALGLLLEMVQTRPIFARTVEDNIGSQRVLERNGFAKDPHDTFFSNARGREVREIVWVLR